MSDKPQGPDWWLASDGTWHPPELHPSIREQESIPADAAPVSNSAVNPPDVPGTSASEADATLAVQVSTKRPTWSGESDRRPDSGPMYPDLFRQAVSGSHLADVITVNFADGEHRDSLDVPAPSSTTGHSGRSDRSAQLVPSSSRTPAEVGAFAGASAKKRWRRH